MRVASDGVVLTAPFDSEEVKQAELIINTYYKDLAGVSHPWLKEHIENGLPKEQEIETILRRSNVQFQKFGSKLLLMWESLTMVELFASCNLYENVQQELGILNEYYNTNIYPYDICEAPHSYRKVYYIRKSNNAKLVKMPIRALPPELFARLIQRIGGLLSVIHTTQSKQLQGLLEQTQKKDADIKVLQRSIDDFNDLIYEKINDIQQKNVVIAQGVADIARIQNTLQLTQQHARNLEATIQLMASSKFWKLREAYIKVTQFRPGYIIELFSKAFIVLRREGISVFVRYFLKYIRHGREYFKQQQLQSPVDLYRQWISNYETEDAHPAFRTIAQFRYQPLISVVTPVYNIEPKYLDACIESVVGQWYSKWELCLYDDASSNPDTIACLQKWKLADKRIKVVFGKKNKHISGATNEALRCAQGEFVALLDHDDFLAPHALYENVRVLQDHPNADFIYSDEDKVDIAGNRHMPFFKPQWSPDLFLSMMYTAHLGVYRKKIVDAIGGFREGYEGAQDYDFVLRFIEQTTPKCIIHIPKVLYHWRELPGSTASGVHVKKYADNNALKALNDYLQRNKINAKTYKGFAPGRYRVHYSLNTHPLVSIIIPFKDKVDLLRVCVQSILHNTNYPNVEILLVDNQSKAEETFAYLQQIKKNKNVRVLTYKKPFNYSAINNFAVQQAKAEYILLLNNDTKAINKDWLLAMMEHAQRPEVGIVGAKLLYSNDTIQHAGVVLGVGGIAGHAFKYMDADSEGYFGQLKTVRNCSAVTGACLLIKKSIYQQVGGLDETYLAVAFNDVDLCLKVLQAGLRILFTPYAMIYHYESVSRGNDEELKKQNPTANKRVMDERVYMYSKWFDVYLKDDPHYNPNLTRISEDYSLATSPEKEQEVAHRYKK